MLLILVLVLRPKEIARYVSVIKCRLSPVSKTVNSLDSNVRFETSKTVESVQNDTVNEKIGNVESALSVDRDRADSLITDSLAKNLVRKDDVRIYTEGKKKRIINVDTLSDNFLSGEHVDVNKLKEMSLVPYDTAYIKVLARGMIDKPLKVYANDFSLSAVKMIALTGGEAIKVVTVRKKKDGSEDSTQ
jgi:ribosomal protein L18E